MVMPSTAYRLEAGMQHAMRNCGRRYTRAALRCGMCAALSWRCRPKAHAALVDRSAKSTHTGPCRHAQSTLSLASCLRHTQMRCARGRTCETRPVLRAIVCCAHVLERPAQFRVPPSPPLNSPCTSPATRILALRRRNVDFNIFGDSTSSEGTFREPERCDRCPCRQR